MLKKLKRALCIFGTAGSPSTERFCNYSSSYARKDSGTKYQIPF